MVLTNGKSLVSNNKTYFTFDSVAAISLVSQKYDNELVHVSIITI